MTEATEVAESVAPTLDLSATGMCLADRLAAIMEEVGGIGKSQENRDQHFKYRGIEDITAKLQRLLAKYRVVIVPQGQSIDRNDFTTAKGGLMHGAYMDMQWTVTCTTGEILVARTFGEGFDMSDKSTNKAATSAYKYLLLQLFMVADPKDDGDASTPEETTGYSGRNSSYRSEDRASSGGASRTAPPQGGGPRLLSEKQVKLVGMLADKCGLSTKESKVAFIKNVVGRDYGSSVNLTSQEASKVIDALKAYEESLQDDPEPPDDDIEF